MNHLIPCPSCNRHVRRLEPACPFCSAALSLADVPEPPLPRTRLGRAATFAFGATLIGASSLVGCGGSAEEGKEGGGGSGGASTAGAAGSGAGTGGDAGGNGSSGGGLIYGAPPVGGTDGEGGGAMALYGAAPAGGTESEAGSSNAGSANAGSANAGSGNFPIYGAAPAD